MSIRKDKPSLLSLICRALELRPVIFAFCNLFSKKTYTLFYFVRVLFTMKTTLLSAICIVCLILATHTNMKAEAMFGAVRRLIKKGLLSNCCRKLRCGKYRLCVPMNENGTQCGCAKIKDIFKNKVMGKKPQSH